MKVKERVKQTGIIVKLFSDEGNCFTEAATTKTPRESSPIAQQSEMTQEITEY